MTVPHDGQPLTRRQLRDLERTGHTAAAEDAVSGAPEQPEAPASSTTDAAPSSTTGESAPTVEHHSHAAPMQEPQTRRARFHGDQSRVDTGEELQVVATGASGDVSEEEAELAEVEDTPTHPVGKVTIDENPSVPVAPVFTSPPPAQTPAATQPPARPGETSFDDLLGTRTVGSSNSISTTSALVLPSVPNHADVGSALDETGEVIITGSIDLPASLSSTGASPAAGLERPDLDALVEGGDRDHTGSDVAPMSASRAVSTHGAPSAMVAPPKRARVNAPLILAITAGVLAIGVVGLLLAAFVFRVF